MSAWVLLLDTHVFRLLAPGAEIKATPGAGLWKLWDNTSQMWIDIDCQLYTEPIEIYFIEE
jgi:hypothetical protein